MRILLADDEPLTVDAMEYMIRKNCSEEFVIEKAYSGKEAVEASMNARPDIVVMDINMPGIDGMEAIRRIRAMYNGVHFLIVTAMEYFDYAVESVKTEEIDEYILKPLKKDVFLEAIHKVVGKIEKQKDFRKKMLHMEEQLQMIIPVLEKNFIATICMDEYSENYISEFCSLFSIKGKKAYIMLAEFGTHGKDGVQNGIGSGMRNMKYYREYCNFLHRNGNCIIGDLVRNRMVVMVYGDFQNAAYSEKQDSIEFVLKFLQQIEKYDDEARIGIGKIYPVAKIKNSFMEACQAMRRYMDYTEDSRIYHIEDIQEEQQDFNWQEDIHRLMELIQSGNREGLAAKTQEMFMAMRQNEKEGSTVNIKNRTLYILAQIHEEYRRSDDHYIEILEQIIKAKSNGEVQHFCEEYLLGVLEQNFADKEEKIENIIEQANQYMLSHLSEKITLEEIAKSVYLSEYYFSRLYKAMTGKNYSDQLLTFRMEKAKELVLEKKYSVREIAEMVGYQDANYLSKVFKKYTGMTISEYRISQE